MLEKLISYLSRELDLSVFAYIIVRRIGFAESRGDDLSLFQREQRHHLRRQQTLHHQHCSKESRQNLNLPFPLEQQIKHRVHRLSGKKEGMLRHHIQ